MDRRSLPLPAARLALGVALPALALIATALAAQKPPAPPKPARDGAAVWRADCAPCHGEKGEGAAGYPKPLAGTRSVGELARLVERTMPPGPRHASPQDARAVAAYLHGAFYSPLARERDRPARVALSRLTVGQLRNAVADLVGGFRAPMPVSRERGLQAEYFKARRFDDRDRVLQRTDPQVAFDFAAAAPARDGFDPHQFSIRWQGSLVAPDTGAYEIVVHSDHSVRLFLNDSRRPLIDAWVKSGSDTAFRAPIFLVAGRAYPIRLEFSKSTQGVDDTDKQKNRKVPPAFVRLAWRRPRLDEEPVPARCLIPVAAPESCVVANPFPPDDRSIGFERGAAVSAAWDDAVTTTALEVSRYVAEHADALAGTRADAPDRRAKRIAFCERFVERAFRRPLDPETRRFFVTRVFDTTADLDAAVRRVALLALKSPRFLYHDPAEATDPWAVASRLSFALWDTLPDDELRRAAGSGALATADGLRAQARRLAADPRATGKLRAFLLTWLKVDHVPELVKDPKRHPGFDAAAATDLRTSLELFLDDAIAGERPDFRDLLLSDKVFVNGRLAKLYGIDLPADAPFQPVRLDPSERAGALTQPYLLSSLAYLAASSPIHRGVLLVRSVLGRTLAPPPVAVAPVAADLHPGLTTRQRVSLQTKPAACMSCHGTINSLGFALERFDAIGRLRASDNGKPVDARGSFRARDGRLVRFDGARELARALSESDEVHAAFVEKCFAHLTKQTVRAYGPQALPALTRTFVANRYDMRGLMAECAVLAARPAPTDRRQAHR